ncbi:MAG TPA: glycosyltransferase [Pyrinomonadaceae bacterium]|nr:glycosyltransferase [Pyrinomonadaceae bacterium]
MSSRRTEIVVSVIVPSYNYAHFIGATFESLQAQTFPNWECIVIDDGSTDDTAEVVARFMKTDSRIRFFRQSNRRQAAARNNGFTQMSGKYVQFLDADDLLESRKFERQVEYLEAHRDVEIVYGDTRYFETDRPDELLYTMYGENRPWQPGLSGSGSDMLLPLVRRNTVIINAALTRRTLVERVGLFDEELPPIEDWEFWIRCALAGAQFRFEDFEETFALVRSHRASSSKNTLRMTASEVRMRRKLKRLLANEPEASSVNAQLLAEAEGTLGAQEVMHGGRARGVYYLSRAVVFDRKVRHRLKWLACALAASFAGRRRFEKVYSSSISQTGRKFVSRKGEKAQRKPIETR